MAFTHETFDGTPPVTTGRRENIEDILLDIHMALEAADERTNTAELFEEHRKAMRALAHIGVNETVTLAA